MAATPLGETGISDQMVKQDVKHNRKSLQALSIVSSEEIAANQKQVRENTHAASLGEVGTHIYGFG